MEEKKERGAPTKYKEIFNEQAYRLCLLGCIDSELAAFFDVEESTINNWKIAHLDFLESINRGKSIADGSVAKALYDKATGYSHPDVDIKMYDGRIIVTPITKHYPPDSTAMIFWLKNRQSRKWRDKQEVEHSGELKNNFIDLTKYTDEELRVIAELQRKGGAGEKSPD